MFKIEFVTQFGYKMATPNNYELNFKFCDQYKYQ